MSNWAGPETIRRDECQFLRMLVILPMQRHNILAKQSMIASGER